jgi:6-phosphogluconolactonase
VTSGSVTPDGAVAVPTPQTVAGTVAPDGAVPVPTLQAVAGAVTLDSPHIMVFATPDLTSQAIAARLVSELSNPVRLTGPVHVAATGGGLGSGMWADVAGDLAAVFVDWTRVHIWFSDERFVPAGDPVRNDATILAVAGELSLPRANIHSAPGSDEAASVEVAAREYTTEIVAGDPWFAVEILGIGPDGHVASLFPGRESPEGLAFAVADSPKPPPQRVSFTRQMLGRCDELWLIAVGAEKAWAVNQALTSGDVPAAGLRGRTATRWFIDQALADAMAGA